MGIEAKHAYRFGYLQSEEWQVVRAEVLCQHEAKCLLCDKFDIENDVHHTIYPRNIWETKASDCVLLCRKCHKLVHEIIRKGFSLKDPKMLAKLRQFVRSEAQRKTAKKQNLRKERLVKQARTPRCISCHLSGIPLIEHVPPGKGRPEMNTNWLWCEECLSLYPKEAPVKWATLRHFFDQRRDRALKILFDNSAESVDTSDMDSGFAPENVS